MIRATLNRLKRWLGWDSDTGPLDFSDLGLARRVDPPQSHVPPRANPPPMAQRKAPRPASPRKPKKESEPMDFLDNPLLTLDKPTQDGFDPYNTGAFNRSASWDKIGRSKR
jgi:hypothetical protein